MSFYIITFAITIFAEMLFLKIMADTFFPKKETVNRKQKALGFIIACLVMAGNAMLFQKLFFLKAFVVFLTIYVYIAAYYHAKAADALGNITFYYSIIVSIDFIGVFLLLCIPEAYRHDWIAQGVTIASKCVELCIGLIIRKVWRKRDIDQMITKKIRRLMFFSGILICMGAVLTDMMNKYDSFPKDVIVLSIALICLSNFSLLYLVLAAGSEIERNRLENIAGQTRTQLAAYKNKQELYTRQGKLIHEHKNQLLTLCHLLEQNQVSQAVTYIQGLTGTITKELDYITTGNPIADAILNMKKQEAADKKISINFLCSDLGRIKLTEEEIIILLGNLLDNAMEAAEKCVTDKSIQVHMIQEEEQLVIAVKNTCGQPLRIENKKILSTKPEAEAHGYGLTAIENIVEKHDGSFTLRQSGEYMKATVVIPGV